MMFLHQYYPWFICPIKNILVLIFENFYCLLDFEFEFESVSNWREIINNNRSDLASLAEGCCSLITRASQLPSAKGLSIYFYVESSPSY